MAFRVLDRAVKRAQELADSDGRARIVVEYLQSDGGDGRFYIEPWTVADALFYEAKWGGRSRSNVTVVRPGPGPGPLSVRSADKEGGNG